MAFITAFRRVSAQQRSRVLFPLQPTLSTLADGDRSVSGVISVNGTPQAHTKVVLLDIETFVRMGWTSTDANGAYTFTGIAPGDYAVVAFDKLGAHRSRVGHTTA